MFIVYITFNISGGGLLLFVEDEITHFRDKSYRFICNGNFNLSKYPAERFDTFFTLIRATINK